jgi:hypothetical protein
MWRRQLSAAGVVSVRGTCTLQAWYLRTVLHTGTQYLSAVLVKNLLQRIVLQRIVLQSAF